MLVFTLTFSSLLTMSTKTILNALVHTLYIIYTMYYNITNHAQLQYNIRERFSRRSFVYTSQV